MNISKTPYYRVVEKIQKAVFEKYAREPGKSAEHIKNFVLSFSDVVYRFMLLYHEESERTGEHAIQHWGDITEVFTVYYELVRRLYMQIDKKEFDWYPSEKMRKLKKLMNQAFKKEKLTKEELFSAKDQYKYAIKSFDEPYFVCRKKVIGILNKDDIFRKTVSGLFKQHKEFYNGFFSSLVKAREKQEITEDLLKDIISPMEKKLKWLEKRYRFIDFDKVSDVYLIAIECLKDIPSCKRKGFREHLRGQIRRKIGHTISKRIADKNILLSFHENELGEHISENYTLDKENPWPRDDKGAIKLEHLYHMGLHPESIILINDAARMIKVAPETLRNWDRKKDFKAEEVVKISVMWKRRRKVYRGYYLRDIPKLEKIRDKMPGRRHSLPKGFITRKKLAKIIGVSTRTILRKEEDGTLPKPKRSRSGYPMYSKSKDTPIIKKLLPR